MKPSRSEFVEVRGLRYHVRAWGPKSGRPVFILHGWMDVSETWQFVVDNLPDWRILAPDWRGFGRSEWTPDTYWFPDYVADLDALVRHFAGADEQIDLIAHSMGSQAGSLYAGVRPERIRRLVCLDGFFVPSMDASVTPARYRGWLDKLADDPTDRSYDSFEDLAARIGKRHSGLDAEAAAFVARCWGEQTDDGRVRLRTDPRHREFGPLLYRSEEAKAVWREITAPVLCLDAGKGNLSRWVSAEERASRLACFSNLTHESLGESGHMMHFDAPAETAAGIARFLGGGG